MGIDESTGGNCKKVLERSLSAVRGVALRSYDRGPRGLNFSCVFVGIRACRKKSRATLLIQRDPRCIVHVSQGALAPGGPTDRVRSLSRPSHQVLVSSPLAWHQNTVPSALASSQPLARVAAAGATATNRACGRRGRKHRCEETFIDVLTS